MSPTPRKPAKPKPATAKEQAALERTLAEGGHPPPPPDVSIRLGAKPPSKAALGRMGIKDPRVAELAAFLAEHSEQIAGQLAEDRELTALLATDPAAALEHLKVPEQLRTGGEEKTRSEFLDRFRGVQVELPAGSKLPDPGRASPATLAAVQLIADTFAEAANDAARFAALKSDPLSVVSAVATTKPPPGLTTGSPAAASVVLEVADQIAAVYGAPARFRAPTTGATVRVPRPPKAG